MKCGGRHSALLHEDETSPADKGFSEVPVSHVVKAAGVHLPCVSVIVNNTFRTNALIDPGSTSTFCSQELFDKLKLGRSAVSTHITIETVTGQDQGQVRQVVPMLRCESHGGNHSLTLRDVGVVNRIPVRNPHIDLSAYEHLKQLESLIPSDALGGQCVDLLIGQDHSDALIPIDVRRGADNEPFAVRYALGWTINGSVSQANRTSVHVVSNFVSSPVQPELINDVGRLRRSQIEVSDDSKGVSAEHGTVVDECISGSDLSEYHRKERSERHTPEVQVHTVTVSDSSSQPVDQQIEHCSSFYKLRGAMDWLVKIKDSLIKKLNPSSIHHISTSDLQHADNQLLEDVQCVSHEVSAGWKNGIVSRWFWWVSEYHAARSAGYQCWVVSAPDEVHGIG